MYTPIQFKQENIKILNEHIRNNPFATLVVMGPNGIEANHLPLSLRELKDGSFFLVGHIAKANDIWKSITSESEVLTIFQGENSYISPSWYASKKEHEKVVPTWNYVAVHVYGYISFINDKKWLQEQIEELTNINESGFNNPWKVSDAPMDFIDHMMNNIVGIEIKISRILGKWKISQNRPESDRLSVIDELEKSDKNNQQVMAKYIRNGV